MHIDPATWIQNVKYGSYRIAYLIPDGSDTNLKSASLTMR